MFKAVDVYLTMKITEKDCEHDVEQDDVANHCTHSNPIPVTFCKQAP